MEKCIEIVATSDVHAPLYLDKFADEIKKIKFLDKKLFLFAGDMIERGKIEYYTDIISLVKKYYSGKIIGILGNDEYDTLLDTLVKEYEDIVWLYDDKIILEINDLSIGIIGTKGSLDKPTWWQSKNIKNIRKIYANRIKKIATLLKELKHKCDIMILLSHYAVTYKNLVGEPKSIWPMLGSNRFEELIKKYRPDVVIHGHAHRSTRTYTEIYDTKIYNVAFPANGRIVIIKLKKEKKGILQYFE